MKTIYWIACLFLFTLSCVTTNSYHKPAVENNGLSFVLENKSVSITNDTLRLRVVNNNAEAVNLMMNLGISSRMASDYTIPMVNYVLVDEEGKQLDTAGEGAHLDGFDTAPDSRKPKTNEFVLHHINKNIELKFPFTTTFKSKNISLSMHYVFKKDKKYFVSVEYSPNQKVIDSLERKGIKAYGKPIISNKIPVTGF
ncbi:MAG: hypothetical protein QM710_06365 [Flavobacterium sp.]